MGFHDISNELSKVSSHYHFHRPPAFVDTLREWLGKLARMLHDTLNELFGQHGSSMDSRSLSALLQVLVYVLGIAAAIAVVYLLTRKLAAAGQEAAQTVRGATTVEEILDAAGWRKQADKLAEKQDYRGACRALYLCLLQDFDEHGIAKFAPTKTNYEYAYLLAGHPGMQSKFRQMADLVETIWFGNRRADEPEYQESLSQLRDIESELKTAAGQAETGSRP